MLEGVQSVGTLMMPEILGLTGPEEIMSPAVAHDTAEYAVRWDNTTVVIRRAAVIYLAIIADI